MQIFTAVEAHSTARGTARAIAWTIVAAALLALGFGLVHAFRRICPNVDPPDDLPTGQALSTLATHVALRRYAFHALGIIVAGLAGAIVAGSLLRLAGYQQHESGGSDAAGFVGSAGLLVAAFGVLCLLNAARIWWCLRRHSWQAWACRFKEVPGIGNGTPTLVLRGHDGEEFLLSVVSVAWRWRALNRCDRGDVWFAGNPAHGGVAAPPGGTRLLWARRPRAARRRESLRQRTLGPPTAR